MKRFSSTLYIIYIFIFVISAIVFTFSYMYLSNEYIAKVTCNSLKNVSVTVSVNVNQFIKEDYDDYKNKVIAIKEELGTESKSNICVKLIEEDYKLQTQDVWFGYYENNSYTLDGHKYAIQNIYYDNKDYYESNVFIGYFSDILQNYDDTQSYCVFRYDNILMYFDTRTYLNDAISNIEGLPENYYMIVSSDGVVVFQKDPNRKQHSIYSEAIEVLDAKYKDFIDTLDDSSFNKINFRGESSYIVHTPVLESIAKFTRTDGNQYNAYSIAYIFTEDVILHSDSYLRTTLFVSLLAIFIVINGGLLISFVIFIRREQDMSMARIRYFFTKPYIIKITTTGHILYFNRSWFNIIKKRRKYKNIKDLDFHGLEKDEVLKAIRNQKPIIVSITNEEEDKFYIRLLPMKIFGGFLLIGDDYTQSLEDIEANENIALYNNVTHLPNRYLLDKDIEELVENPSNKNNKMVLVGVNVLDFVKINKMFGFISGDKLLRESKRIFEESIAEFDAKIYNIRTSLFMILFRDCADYTQIINWAKKVIECFKQPIQIKDNYQTVVDVKLGIYNIDMSNEDQVNAKHIYECAYSALERAMSSRFSHYVTYNYEFGNMLTREQVMEQDLFRAIKNDEFIMYYQPQYNTKIGRIVGFEALIRWNNPRYINENVEHYISIAERNGLIVELGNIIFEKTFAFAKLIEDSGIHISINVSPAQLLYSGFVSTLMNYFDRFKLKKGLVAIEITETFLMENSNVMIEKLRLLQEKGFDIHLDDFGIGYSSMMYLKDLPVNTIKIDKEFTKYFLLDKFSRTIVTRIAQLALGLDLNLIVEGVENEKQMIALSKIGCDVIQGYLISKPVNEEMTFDLIKKYNGIDIRTKEIIKTVETKPIVKQKQRKVKEKDEATILESEALSEIDKLGNIEEDYDRDMTEEELQKEEDALDVINNFGDENQNNDNSSENS